ncbi:MAG: asparagine synthase (glutamine-hydrolyzing) [Oligoflexia bacterium]|nr:asparagine synthase (glutamine-hydrolyzing) [Oligoflexia bacterium]
MCGIIGSLHFDKKRDFSLQPVLNIMKHRGPDETHVIEEDYWSAGVNRLAITAKEEKNTQPLWSPDKRFCFIFNGQIYNYKELKSQLLELNYSFKTHCDSEVLFYAYLEWGVSAFLKCQGMFAMAVFDTLEKKWILARDPLGIKPLYFYFSAESFIFSSEIKPLLSLKNISINKEVLPYYLQRRFVIGKETFFKDICRLLPGECVSVDREAKKMEHIKYWTAGAKSKLLGKNPKERLTEFSKELERSVDISSRSAESIGVLLSGGLDSSVIHSLFSSYQKDSDFKKANWFFDNTYDSAERKFAKKQAEKWNQKLYKVYPDEKDFLLLPKIIRALEEPLADSIVVPTYKLMKTISQKQRILISGEGADELLAGYAHHWLFYFFEKLYFWNMFSMFGALKIFPESVLNFFLPYPGSLKKQRLLESLSVLKKSGLKKYIETSHLWTSGEMKILFNEDSIPKRPVDYPEIHSLKDLQSFDIQNWLANYNLLRVDKLSMAFSIEVRLPYLNLDFVECCLSLQEKDIVSLFRRKKILREASYKQAWLDFEFSNRKKHPFTWREKAVYNNPLYKEFVWDHLDESFRKTWDINSSALNKVLEDSFLPHKNLLADKQVTSLLHLSLWTKEFFN